MTRSIILFIVIGLFVLAAIGAAFYFYLPESDQAGQEIKISATIFPLYDIAQNIGGEKINVKLIAPPGASPHTFEVTAEQVKKMQNTKIIFAIGHGLDEWTAQITSSIPGAQTFTVSKNIDLHESNHESHEEEHGHHHGDVNPHYWLNINNAKIISKNILDELTRLDPQNTEYFQNNYNEYLQALEQADQEINNILGSISSKKMITMHDAWPYFAEEYGLEVVATFEPFPGREPTPQYLAELSQTAEENNIKTIFSEPQLSNQALIPFLRDLNMELAILDPIGGLEERDSYINMMKYNASIIHEALK